MSFLKKLREVNQKRLGIIDKEFNSKQWSLLEWAGALCGESGELANILKKVKRREGKETYDAFLNAKIPSIAEELADVVLYCDLIAGELDIDLEQAITNKFNKKSNDWEIDVKI